MKQLTDLMHLCIELDAIFEIQNRTVKVIKYDGEWFPNKKPILWKVCHVDDLEGLENIYGKLKGSCE